MIHRSKFTASTSLLTKSQFYVFLSDFFTDFLNSNRPQVSKEHAWRKPVYGRWWGGMNSGCKRGKQNWPNPGAGSKTGSLLFYTYRLVSVWVLQRLTLFEAYPVR